jgi:hypothetical protein
MKLIEVVNTLQEQEKKPGTYAGVRFDTATKQKLHKYMSDNKIPTSVRPDKLHTTLLYSRKHLPNYKPAGKVNMTGTPTKFDVWKTRGENSPATNALVLEYSCPELVTRHKALMKEHDATFDYPEYKTHVTLSYDIGDLDVSNLDAKDIGPLKLVEEYREDLDLDWARNKGVKKGG